VKIPGGKRLFDRQELEEIFKGIFIDFDRIFCKLQQWRSPKNKVFDLTHSIYRALQSPKKSTYSQHNNILDYVLFFLTRFDLPLIFGSIK
jgi:hypothetical protein